MAKKRVNPKMRMLEGEVKNLRQRVAQAEPLANGMNILIDTIWPEFEERVKRVIEEEIGVALDHLSVTR